MGIGGMKKGRYIPKWGFRDYQVKTTLAEDEKVRWFSSV